MREENHGDDRPRIVNYLHRHGRTPSRPASFVTYFHPDFPSILYLICCLAHCKQEVVQELEKRDIIYADGSSRINLIPEEDVAFVFVSEGIHPLREEDMNDVCLR